MVLAAENINILRQISGVYMTPVSSIFDSNASLSL